MMEKTIRAPAVSPTKKGKPLPAQKGRPASGLRLDPVKADTRVGAYTVEITDKWAVLSMVVLWLAAFLGLGGNVWSCFAWECPVYPLVAVGVLVVAVLVLGLTWRRARLLIFSLAGGCFLLFCLLAWPALTDGFSVAANHVSGVFSMRTGMIFPLFAAGGENDALHLTLFLCAASAVFSTLCVYIVHTSGHWLYAGLAVVSIGGMWVFAGVSPAAGWGVLAFFAWVLLFYRRVMLRRNARPIAGAGGVVGLCLLLVVLLVSGLVAAPVGLLAAPALAAARGNARDAAEDKRYQRQPTNNMPEGDMARLGGLQLNNTAALEVIMSRPESLYLKGYVGGVFAGDHWEPVDTGALAPYANTFYWLHNAGFYGQTQLARLVDTVEPGTGLIDVTVNNLNGSSKYIYTPYELAMGDGVFLDAARIGDQDIPAEGFWGQRVYRFQSLPNQVKRYPELAGRLHENEGGGDATIDNYLVQESHYNTFVYQNYLTLSQEDSAFLNRVLGDSNFEGQNHVPYQRAKQLVLDKLTSAMAYDPAAPDMAQGDAFLSWFMDESQRGWSVHFATAAALMFRYYGIPARYVEGYLITPGDVDGVLANAAITLDGTHAHAWCEIYHDGVGWIPFETTPPYLTVMEQPALYETYDIAGGGAGEGGGAGSEMPMDNFDEPLQELSPEEIGTALWQWLAAAIIAVALILMLLFALRTYRGRRAVKARALSFHGTNTADAIREMHRYLLRLQDLMGYGRLDRYPEDHLAFVEANPRYAGYSEVLAICRKARYSRQQITEADRDTVEQYSRMLVHDLDAKSSLGRRLALKYVYFVY